MLQGLNKGAAYTMQRRFAVAIATRPFRMFVDMMLYHNEKQIIMEELWEYWSKFAFKGCRNEYELLGAIAEAADTYPPKDTFVAPQGTEWSLMHQVIEQPEKYKMPIKDLTDGDLGRFAEDMSAMEHEPSGTLRKGIGKAGTLMICKMPNFQAVGFGRETDGLQPLGRQMRLAQAAVFPKPSFDSVVPNGRHLGVTLLDMMSGTDSRSHVILLAEAIRESKCGLIFDEGDGERAYDRLLDGNLRNYEPEILRRVKGYDTLDPKLVQTMENAHYYDKVVGWRNRPVGCDDDGRRAIRVGQICEAQLPAEYILRGVRSLLRGMRARYGSGTGTTAAADRQQALENEVSLLFGVNVRVPASGRFEKKAGSNTDAEVREAFGRAAIEGEFAGPGGRPPAAPVVFASPLDEIFAYATEASTRILDPWRAALKTLLEKNAKVAKPLFSELASRLKAVDTDVARNEVHARHAAGQFEAIGLKPETAASLTDEHVRQFRAALPTPAALAATKTVPRTDVAIWGRANATLDAAGGYAPRGGAEGAEGELAGGEFISPSRSRAHIHHMATTTTEELVTMALIYSRPWNLDTCVRMAEIGIPIVTGQLERWALTINTLSALVAKSDEVCDTIMTPMRVTVTSRGVRRITDFTEEFAMGQRWGNPEALAELPNLWPNGVGHGWGTRIVSDMNGVRDIIRGANKGARADVLFVPRSIGEDTLAYPMNWTGAVWTKPAKVNTTQRQLQYHTHSGYALYRAYMGTHLASFIAKMKGDAVIKANGSVSMDAMVVVDRAPTMVPDLDGVYSIAENGTGPIGEMIMQHHQSRPHIVFKGRGGLFALDPTKGTLPPIAAH